MTIKDAKRIANRLLRLNVGTDHRIMDMPSFYGSFVQALQAAYQKGWNDRAEAEPLVTKHSASKIRNPAA
jgi:hypothetical protein